MGNFAGVCPAKVRDERYMTVDRAWEGCLSEYTTIVTSFLTCSVASGNLFLRLNTPIDGAAPAVISSGGLAEGSMGVELH